jgi:hypothetical protein
MTFTNRVAPPSVTLVPGAAHSALQGLGAPDALPASPSPGAAVPGPWTPPAAAEQVAMVRPIVKGLQWAVRNPRVMRGLINWIEKRAATQATRYLGSGADRVCLRACGQATRNAMSKAATPGGMAGAQTPQELASRLNRLFRDEFARVSQQIPEAVRSTYQAAFNDAIEGGVKALTHTLRTALVSGAAGVLGKIGWDEGSKLLREANRPETPEDIRLLREIQRELRDLRQDIPRSPAR